MAATENTHYTRSTRVSHLGGIEAGYRMAGPYKQYKPTLILVNSFTTASDLYAGQFKNEKLTEAMNLIAIEPLGHGKSKLRGVGQETFTYWDTAVMILQVMDVIGVKKAFALGTSQGGWIVARLALIAPERIAGIIPLGTSMDYESERSRKLGCWDPVGPMTELIASATSATEVSSYEPTDDYCNYIVDIGFGKDCPASTRTQWTTLVKANYQGDDGRKRIRECAVNLRDRDGLHGRLVNIKCPVLWLHGDADVVYSPANAKEEIKMFEGSPDAQVVVVPGGHHFLSWTHPEQVDGLVYEFVMKYSKGQHRDGRALREAVGMVEM